MYKKIIALTLAALLPLACTGCRQDNELPTDINNVGSTIKIDEDLLDQSKIEFNQSGIPQEVEGLELNELCLVGLDLEYATTDDVKGWLEDVVSGEYSSGEDELLTNAAYETASLKNGGKVSIVTYDGYYFKTEFTFSPDDGQAFSKISKCLAAYVGRPLAESESVSLMSALSSVLNGAEMGYVQPMENSASVFLMLDENGDLLVQAR